MRFTSPTFLLARAVFLKWSWWANQKSFRVEKISNSNFQALFIQDGQVKAIQEDSKTLPGVVKRFMKSKRIKQNQIKNRPLFPDRSARKIPLNYPPGRWKSRCRGTLKNHLIFMIFRNFEKFSGMVRYAKTQLSVSCLTIKFVSCFIVDRVVFFGKISCFLREFSSLIFDFLRPFESLFRFILVKIPWNTLFWNKNKVFV